MMILRWAFPVAVTLVAGCGGSVPNNVAESSMNKAISEAAPFDMALLQRHVDGCKEDSRTNSAITRESRSAAEASERLRTTRQYYRTLPVSEQNLARYICGAYLMGQMEAIGDSTERLHRLRGY